MAFDLFIWAYFGLISILFIGVGHWLVGLLFGLSWAIILVGFGLVYLLNLVLGLTLLLIHGCDISFYCCYEREKRCSVDWEQEDNS